MNYLVVDQTTLQSGFPRGRIIPSDDVIGRQGFLKRLEERLYYGDSVMLAGPRRTGKSSAAFEVLRGLTARNCYTLDIDLLHVIDMEHFALQVLKKVTQLRAGVLQHAASSMQDFLRWIAKPDLSVKVQDVEFGLRFQPDAARVEPMTVLQEAFEMAERIAKKDERRLIFLLDEFQEVDRLGGDGLLRMLRSVFQRQENVTYLFLGSEPSMLKTIFSDQRQAFYRFATILHLPDIEAQEWVEYTHKKLAALGMGIEESAMQSILTITGGHPYCMMTALTNAFFEAKNSGVELITGQMAMDSLNQTFEQLDAIYEDLWKKVLEIQDGEAVLAAIAAGDPPYRGKSPTTVRRAIDALIKTSIIVRTARGQYHFVEPMFQRWIITNIRGGL